MPLPGLTFDESQRDPVSDPCLTVFTVSYRNIQVSVGRKRQKKRIKVTRTRLNSCLNRFFPLVNILIFYPPFPIEFLARWNFKLSSGWIRSLSITFSYPTLESNSYTSTRVRRVVSSSRGISKRVVSRNAATTFVNWIPVIKNTNRVSVESLFTARCSLSLMEATYVRTWHGPPVAGPVIPKEWCNLAISLAKKEKKEEAAAATERRNGNRTRDLCNPPVI